MTAQIPTVATATLPRSEEKAGQLRFLVAWFFCLLLYFLQYALRSAPGVMIPELIAAFGLTALGVSSLLGLYYYTISFPKTASQTTIRNSMQLMIDEISRSEDA